MFNKIIVMGRICHELELKTTPAGLPVMSFRVAVDRRYQSKGEERKTDFFNVVAWRSNAEFISKYFGKGRMILIEGELQTRQYTDKNGQQRDVVEIVADNASFTGEAKQGGSAPGGYQTAGSYGGYDAHPAASSSAASAPAPGTAKTPAPESFSSMPDDDYPF